MFNKAKSLLYIYASTFFSFITSLLLAKSLGDELYGYIALGIAIGSIIQIVINFGMDKSLLRELTSLHEPDVEASIIAGFISNRLFVFLFISISIIAISFLLLFFSLYQLEKHALGLLIGYIVFQSMLGLYPKGAFEYIEKIIIQNKILFYERLTICILVAIFVNYFKESSVLILISLMIIGRVLSISIQFKCIGFFESYKKLIHRNISCEISSGGYITIALLFNSLIYYGMQLIVPLSHGLEEVSAIGIALQFCLVVTIAQTQICRFVNKSIFLDEKQNELNNKVLKMLVISIPLALLYVFAVFLCKQYYLTEGYKNLVYHSYILGFWLIFLGPGLIINQYVIAKKLDSTYMKVSVSSSFLCLAMSYYISTFNDISFISLSLLIPHCISMLVQYLMLLRSNSETVHY
jgi:O-antigen/teichoic acid export membrane protein